MESDPNGCNDSDDTTDERLPAAGAGQAQELARERDRAPRQSETDKILADADQRDDAATARDVTSDKREMVADLKAFLDRDEAYAGLDERRAAAWDRSQAKGDREASAQDRAELTKPAPDPDAGNGPAEGPVTIQATRRRPHLTGQMRRIRTSRRTWPSQCPSPGVLGPVGRAA